MCITNAASESVNSKVQRIKSVACGFLSRDRLWNAIHLHLGWPRSPPRGRLRYSRLHDGPSLEITLLFPDASPLESARPTPHFRLLVAAHILTLTLARKIVNTEMVTISPAQATMSPMSSGSPSPVTLQKYLTTILVSARNPRNISARRLNEVHVLAVMDPRRTHRDPYRGLRLHGRLPGESQRIECSLQVRLWRS